MKIVVTPPTGPYLIDSMIELSYLIDPTPPGLVICKWRALTGLYSYWEPDGQNISYTPSSDFHDFRHLWFYCRAFPNAVKAPALAEVIEVCGKPVWKLFVYLLDSLVCRIITIAWTHISQGFIQWGGRGGGSFPLKTPSFPPLLPP